MGSVKEEGQYPARRRQESRFSGGSARNPPAIILSFLPVAQRHGQVVLK